MSDKPTPLSRHTSDDIGAMLEAGERVRECQRVLARTGATVVTEALNGDKLEDNWSHYPRGDVFDQQSGSQFYFHAHRDVTGEVGHFHTFLRTSDIGGGEVSAMHLVAISMNRLGQAQTLFTTNRWVTGESWQPAERVTEALPGFEIDHAAPSWPLNIWITSMLRLFRFEIDWLLCKRDIEIDSHVSSGRALEEVLNDRTLEICAALPISVDRRINLLRAEKARRDQG
jgi:hypothetical protein